MSDTHAATVPHGAPAGHGLKQPYHLVDPSPWPIIGAVGGFLVVLGIILAAHYGSYIVLIAGDQEYRSEESIPAPAATKAANR